MIIGTNEINPHTNQKRRYERRVELAEQSVAAVDNVVGGGRFGGDGIFSRLGLLCEH